MKGCTLPKRIMRLIMDFSEMASIYRYLTTAVKPLSVLDDLSLVLTAESTHRTALSWQRHRMGTSCLHCAINCCALDISALAHTALTKFGFVRKPGAVFISTSGKDEGQVARQILLQKSNLQRLMTVSDLLFKSNATLDILGGVSELTVGL